MHRALAPRLGWSALKLYDFKPPGQNHGLMLATRSWRPQPFERGREQRLYVPWPPPQDRRSSLALQSEGNQMLDLVGTWRLTAAYFVAQETGNRLDLFSAKPLGYAVFESNGRMIARLTSGGRTPAA